MHPLDNSCPIQGQGSAKSQLQNQAKNNFCAAGAPVSLTYQNFKSLQTAVKNNSAAGWKHLTDDHGQTTAGPETRLLW
jgi:hypothetical protein